LGSDRSASERPGDDRLADARPVETVGFIGLGDQGGAMASRIIEAGWSTVLWSRRPEVLGGFAAPNVSTTASAADLGAAADLIGICVWADDDVREVVIGDGGVLDGCRPGTIVALHSTILPETCREIERLAAARGTLVLDAPVSGGRAVAFDGGLTVAVGGVAAALERARPVFDAFARTVEHVGEVGSGQTAKLLNNAVLAANLAVADEALALGQRLGLDPAALAAFMRTGSGRSYGLDVAYRCRTSAATRQAALPALEKDLRQLAVVAEGHRATDLLRLVGEAIDRFREAPAVWETPEEEHS
jgi:3-hydroxyisobutyrate dehydrogenase